MPLPLIPLISAGASLLGQGMNAAFTAANNRRQREFAREMYGIQRADSIADWQMQNEYNSPANQMKRFLEAGLNPNLIYGSANNNTATVRSSQPGNFNPEPTRIDMSQITEPLMSIYDVRVKQAQTDNLQQQLETSKQQTLLTAAQVANTAASTAQTQTNTAQGKFNLSQAQQLNQTVLDKAEADLSKTYADTAYTLDANERAAVLQAPTIQNAIENILNSRIGRNKTGVDIERAREEIRNIKRSGVLMDLDINLQRAGIQRHDPAWMRAISQMVNSGNIVDKAKKILNNLGDKIKEGVKSVSPFKQIDPYNHKP